MLILLPSLTLLAGVGQAVASPGRGWSAEGMQVGGLAAAAIAPIMAAVILSLVAPRFDVVLFSASAMLAEIGAVTLVHLGVEAANDRAFYTAIANRHLLFVCAGFVLLVVGAWAAPHVDRIRRLPYTLGFVALALTLVTVVAGQSVNGAKLWLQLGPLRFQPSEVARFLLAAFVAMYLYDRRHLVSDTWRIGRFAFPPAPYLIPLALGVLASVAVLAAQNDLGMAALIAFSVSAVVAGAMQSRSGSLVTVGLILLAAASAYVVAPRVRARVSGWLEPWSVPLGSGYQFIQAEYVAAAGGILGVAGGGASSRVPEIHTDFVLVAVGGEFGLVGAAAVLALCALLVLRCVIAALRDGSGAGQYLALSLATLLGVQIILIVGGVLRVLPLTGLTLPLVSYGGTSMLVTFFGLGVVLGIGARGTTQRARNAEYT